MILRIILLTDDGQVILGQQHNISATLTHKIIVPIDGSIIDDESRSMLNGMETTFEWQDIPRHLDTDGAFRKIIEKGGK